MFPPKALLSLILVSLTAVDATPLSRSTGKAVLTINTRINADDTPSIIEKDRARARFLQNPVQLDRNSTSFNVTNARVTYTTQVGVGSPPVNYTLLIDTGSSNTWIGASKAYTPTNTSNNTGDAISVSYGSGFFFGEEWTDTVLLTPDLVIENQSIGVAGFSSGFNNLDGILGLGPARLTNGTVNNMGIVPTVPDNLLSQGKISEEVIGIYYVPFSEPTSNGTLTFGGFDNSVITGSVTYVPLTTTSPASKYWGIDQSVHYGNTTILSTTAGIVDTGTSLILITSDAFNKYKSATGSFLDSNTGLLAITPPQYSALKTLTFQIGGTSYDLSPNAQIWPRSLNTFIGGTIDLVYLIVSDIGTPSGSGLDFINGYAFLERYYSIYDTANKQVGFASTAYTNATTN